MGIYIEVIEQLTNDFRTNPVNYIAEADLQVSLIERLRSQLSPDTATAAGMSLHGTSEDSFKRDYWRTIQRQLTHSKSINRVHAEVSVRKGERVDVGVFRPKINGPIEWVSGGSKRFNVDDLECVYELKFVKNKTSFPKHSGNPVEDVADNPPSVTTILERADSSDPLLDFDENKIRADIHELNRLSTVDNRYLLLFSNNNYLYHDPTMMESDKYRYGDLYHRMGRAAREWMATEADDGVEIVYVHPRGKTWISD